MKSLLEGKVTITIKVDVAEDIDAVKDGNSVKKTLAFATVEGLHEKAEQITLTLINKLKKKFPTEFKQTKLGEGEATV